MIETEDGFLSEKDGRLYEVYTDPQGSRLWINADDGSAVHALIPHRALMCTTPLPIS